MKKLIGVAVMALALSACGGSGYVRPGPNDQLPPGAVVVYSNMGGEQPVRILKVDGCYLTEVLSGSQWLLNNKAFLGADPDARCGADAAPSAP